MGDYITLHELRHIEPQELNNVTKSLCDGVYISYEINGDEYYGQVNNISVNFDKTGISDLCITYQRVEAIIKGKQLFKGHSRVSCDYGIFNLDYILWEK